MDLTFAGLTSGLALAMGGLSRSGAGEPRTTGAVMYVVRT
jgi:hypothetical protein